MVQLLPFALLVSSTLSIHVLGSLPEADDVPNQSTGPPLSPTSDISTSHSFNVDAEKLGLLSLPILGGSPSQSAVADGQSITVFPGSVATAQAFQDSGGLLGLGPLAGGAGSLVNTILNPQGTQEGGLSGLGGGLGTVLGGVGSVVGGVGSGVDTILNPPQATQGSGAAPGAGPGLGGGLASVMGGVGSVVNTISTPPQATPSSEAGSGAGLGLGSLGGAAGSAVGGVGSPVNTILNPPQATQGSGGDSGAGLGLGPLGSGLGSVVGGVGSLVTTILNPGAPQTTLAGAGSGVGSGAGLGPVGGGLGSVAGGVGSLVNTILNPGAPQTTPAGGLGSGSNPLGGSLSALNPSISISPLASATPAPLVTSALSGLEGGSGMGGITGVTSSVLASAVLSSAAGGSGGSPSLPLASQMTGVLPSVAGSPSAVPGALTSVVPEILTSATPQVLSSAVPQALTSAVPQVLGSSVPAALTSAVPGILSSAIPTALTPAVPGVLSSATPAALTSAVSGILSSAVSGPATSAIPGILSSAAPQVLTSAVSGILSSAAPQVLTSAVPGILSSAAPQVLTSAVPDILSSAVSGPATSAIPGILSSAAPQILTSAVPGILSSAVPGALISAVPGILTSAVPQVLTSAVPTILSSAVPGALTSAIPGIPTSAVPQVLTSAIPGIVTPVPAELSAAAQITGILGSLPAVLPSELPAVVSQLAPLLSEAGTALPGILGQVTSELSLISAAVPSIGPLVNSVVADLTSVESVLTSVVMSGVTQILSNIATIAVALPGSLTVPVALPTGLVPNLTALPLPTGTGELLPNFISEVTSILGPSNLPLAQSIASAVISPLESMVSSPPQLSSLLDGASVLVGVTSSMVPVSQCSAFTVTGGSMVAVTVPCNGSTAVISSAGTSSSAVRASAAATPGVSVSTAIAPGVSASAATAPGLSASAAATPGMSASAAATPGIVPTAATNTSLPSPSPSPMTPPQTGTAVTSPRAATAVTSPQAGTAVTPPQAATAVTPPQAATAVTSPQPLTSMSSVVTQVVTVTSVQISLIASCATSSGVLGTLCPAVLPCAPYPSESSPANGGTQPISYSSSPSANEQGPCPGQGYTCDDCLNGWFCPPVQTPAVSAPCGMGWPCVDCIHSWFCVPTAMPASGPLPTAGPSSPGAGTTLTATSFVTVPAQPWPSQAYHPDVAGWAYVGCFQDDPSNHVLQNDSLSGALGGMTSTECVTWCQSNGFSVAGISDGNLCLCGDALVDSWLLDDSACNVTCNGDATCPCGGPSALSVWGPNGKAAQQAGPKLMIELPASPPPGQSDIKLHPGGVRQSVIPVTSAVFMYPQAQAPSPWDPTTSCAEEVTKVPVAKPLAGGAALDVDKVKLENMASTVHAMVSAAMYQAQQMAAAEVARANSVVNGAKSLVGLGLESIADELNAVVSRAALAPRDAGGADLAVVGTTCITTTCPAPLVKSTPPLALTFTPTFTPTYTPSIMSGFSPPSQGTSALPVPPNWPGAPSSLPSFSTPTQLPTGGQPQASGQPSLSPTMFGTLQPVPLHPTPDPTASAGAVLTPTSKLSTSRPGLSSTPGVVPGFTPGVIAGSTPGLLPTRSGTAGAAPVQGGSSASPVTGIPPLGPATMTTAPTDSVSKLTSINPGGPMLPTYMVQDSGSGSASDKGGKSFVA